MSARACMAHGRSVRGYARFLVSTYRARLLLSFVLSLLCTALQGVGLMMILPLLGLIGIGGGASPEGGIVRAFASGFGWVGLPVTLGSVLAAFVSIIFLQSFMARQSERLNARIVNNLSARLRQMLFEAVTGSGWRYLVAARASNVTHALTTDVQRVSGATQQALQGVMLVLQVGVYLSVAAVLSPGMTAVALVSAGVLLVLLRPYNRRVHASGVGQQFNMRALFAHIADLMGGMKVAKAHGLERAANEHFRRFSEQVEHHNVEAVMLRASSRLYFQTFSALALAACLYLAVEVARMSEAELLLLVFVFARGLPIFSSIQQTWQGILNNMPSFENVRSMMDEFTTHRDPSAREGAPPAPLGLASAMEVQAVSFAYSPDAPLVLREVSASFPARSMTAVVGPTGSGKSTLADILIGLLPPVSGRVFIDGAPLEGDTMGRWRASVGYVPQETFLLNASVRENLLWARPSATEAELLAALDAVSARAFVEALPEGMDTVLGDRGSRLSGGQRQLISLARALLREPALLVMDEATSNLDMESERMVRDAVERLRAGALTIVQVAHRLDAVRRADRILVMDRGRIVEQGTWDELASREGGLFARMLTEPPA
jgi:ATP-binding cassette subfamily C protein